MIIDLLTYTVITLLGTPLQSNAIQYNMPWSLPSEVYNIQFLLTLSEMCKFNYNNFIIDVKLKVVLYWTTL